MTHLDTVAARHGLQDAGKYLLANELTWGNSGNLSARIGPEHFLITATGAFLGNLVEPRRAWTAATTLLDISAVPHEFGRGHYWEETAVRQAS